MARNIREKLQQNKSTRKAPASPSKSPGAKQPLGIPQAKSLSEPQTPAKEPPKASEYIAWLQSKAGAKPNGVFDTETHVKFSTYAKNMMTELANKKQQANVLSPKEDNLYTACANYLRYEDASPNVEDAAVYLAKSAYSVFSAAGSKAVKTTDEGRKLYHVTLADGKDFPLSQFLTLFPAVKTLADNSQNHLGEVVVTDQNKIKVFQVLYRVFYFMSVYGLITKQDPRQFSPEDGAAVRDVFDKLAAAVNQAGLGPTAVSSTIDLGGYIIRLLTAFTVYMTSESTGMTESAPRMHILDAIDKIDRLKSNSHLNKFRGKGNDTAFRNTFTENVKRILPNWSKYIDDKGFVITNDAEVANFGSSIAEVANLIPVFARESQLKPGLVKQAGSGTFGKVFEELFSPDSKIDDSAFKNNVRELAGLFNTSVSELGETIDEVVGNPATKSPFQIMSELLPVYSEDKSASASLKTFASTSEDLEHLLGFIDGKEESYLAEASKIGVDPSFAKKFRSDYFEKKKNDFFKFKEHYNPVTKGPFDDRHIQHARSALDSPETFKKLSLFTKYRHVTEGWRGMGKIEKLHNVFRLVWSISKSVLFWGGIVAGVGALAWGGKKVYDFFTGSKKPEAKSEDPSAPDDTKTSDTPVAKDNKTTVTTKSRSINVFESKVDKIFGGI